MIGMENKENTAAEKIKPLMKYRESLDESERELFDMLIQYANEVAVAVGIGVRPMQQAC